MNALRITKGNLIRTIGMKPPGVLTVILSCIDIPEQGRNRVKLELGGMESDTRNHVNWSSLKLQVGDKVIVEVIEECDGDTPDEIKVTDLAKDEAARKNYLRSEAKRLGWTLIESGAE